MPLVELPRIEGRKQVAIQEVHFRHPAHFTLEDKAILMREEVAVISTVAAAFMSGSSVEDAEKN